MARCGCSHLGKSKSETFLSKILTSDQVASSPLSPAPSSCDYSRYLCGDQIPRDQILSFTSQRKAIVVREHLLATYSILFTSAGLITGESRQPTLTHYSSLVLPHPTRFDPAEIPMTAPPHSLNPQPLFFMSVVVPIDLQIQRLKSTENSSKMDFL